MDTEEKKEIKDAVIKSDVLIDEENKIHTNQIQRMLKIKSMIDDILIKEDVTVGEWGYVVEQYSEKIGKNVSLIKLNSLN